jgi:hypothetical protein
VLNQHSSGDMKNPALNRVFSVIGMLILISLAYQNVRSSLRQHPNPPQDLQVSDQFYNHAIIVTIPDIDFSNSITLRIRCNDSILLHQLSGSTWKLITMKGKDPGIEPVPSDNTETLNALNRIEGRLQIEIIKKNIQNDVIAYYIQRKPNTDRSETKTKSSYVETEFISPYESFGGFIQMVLHHLSNEQPIWFHAQVLDDPMSEPKTEWMESPYQNQFINIGFNDKKGLLHPWRVLIRHDLTTFPIICWTGETRLP